MEEDIKILEDFIKYFEAEAISTKYRRNISITVGEDDIQAIENLIKGYRELEEKYNELMIKHLRVIDKNNDYKDNYIPKSKIKEIRDKAEVMDYYVLSDVIDDLNKILED